MSTETTPIDPTTGHPVAGDTVVYTASNDAVFGGTVEESHLDVTPSRAWRFRIIGHDGLFNHNSEEWKSRVISRPVPVFEPSTVGLATVLDGHEERQVRGAWVQGKGGIYFAPFVARPSGRNMFFGDTMLNFVPDEARPLPTREEVVAAIRTVDLTVGGYLLGRIADAVMALFGGESR